MNWTSCRHRVSAPKGYYCHASALRFAKALLSTPGEKTNGGCKQSPLADASRAETGVSAETDEEVCKKKKIKGLIHPALAAAENIKMGAELIS